MNSIKAFFNSIDGYMPNDSINEDEAREQLDNIDLDGITGEIKDEENNSNNGDNSDNSNDNSNNNSNDNSNDNDDNSNDDNNEKQVTGLGLNLPNYDNIESVESIESSEIESESGSNSNLSYSNSPSQIQSQNSNFNSGSTSFISIIINSILFIPHLILIKPLIIFWKILTYPINYIIKSIILNNNYQINSKTEMIKHENIISNNIKSPSSSSKYIIPPPQRLFPLIRNPNKIKRKTLVLDLDETLIHSLSKGSPRTLTNNDSNIIEIKLNDIATLYHVHKRPYCDYFLKEIIKYFDLYIFTASVKEYADPIIDWLESEIPESTVFKKRFYRNDCTYRNGVGYIKDLSKFFEIDDLKNVLILDNSPVSYALHEDNAIVIEGWINDLNDKELLNLLPLLQSLSICIDVRFLLGLRRGEKIVE